MGFKEQPYQNWFDQAKRTFSAIDNDIGAKDFNWACFKAQQAVEFALKSFLYGLGLPIFGHSVRELGNRIENHNVNLKFDSNCLIFLDKLYIPTRYADAFPSGSPFSFYILEDANKAKICAQQIITTIENEVRTIIEQEKKKSQDEEELNNGNTANDSTNEEKSQSTDE